MAGHYGTYTSYISIPYHMIPYLEAACTVNTLQTSSMFRLLFNVLCTSAEGLPI